MDELFDAIGLHDNERVKDLLKAGANPNLVEGDDTALIWACIMKNEEVARLLLRHGARANAHGKNGTTALIMASYLGLLNTVSHLLEAGCEVDEGDDDGQTPLMLAAKEGHLNVVGLLLEWGANVNFTDDHHRAALHWSVIGGDHREVVTLLIDKGADTKSVTKYRKTAYEIAKNLDHPGVAELLRVATN